MVWRLRKSDALDLPLIPHRLHIQLQPQSTTEPLKYAHKAYFFSILVFPSPTPENFLDLRLNICVSSQLENSVLRPPHDFVLLAKQTFQTETPAYYYSYYYYYHHHHYHHHILYAVYLYLYS